jgi:uncharacterized protein YdeI (YjbR/CyaY-like superfamily)
VTSLESSPRFHPLTRAEWRAWLTAHHADTQGVWLVSWKAATGRPRVSYDDAVSEALAFGWVDSLPRRLDTERTMLYFSRRKPTSAWSRPNKKRVDELRRQGLMTEAGERVIAEATRNGAWSRLDDVENLVEPDDLVAALAGTDSARVNWDAFPPSARRGILEWIVQAKRPDTRARRVAETARLAAQNIRANQWRGAR